MGTIDTWDITETCGYLPKTTFWEDFSIAERRGSEEIKDTFDRVFYKWKDNTIYLTELCMVLSRKSWQMFDNKNDMLSRIYAELHRKACNHAEENLKGADLEYFIRVIE